MGQFANRHLNMTAEEAMRPICFNTGCKGEDFLALRDLNADLLEALKEARKFIPTCPSGCACGSREARAQVEAAIAKAESR